MFDGRSYHLEFEEACEKLVYENEIDEVRLALMGIEWVLWEAIRGVFFLTSVILSLLITLPFAGTIKETMGTFWGATVIVSFVIVAALAIYCLMRIVFWAEISRHLTGRKFGDGGLP